jgi:hypothetical protein
MDATLHFDPTVLRYIDSRDAQGQRLPESANNWSGRVRVTIPALSTKGQMMIFPRFDYFPGTDSCATVTVDSITFSSTSKVCSVLSQDAVTLTVCSHPTCATPFLSEFLRTGEIARFTINPNPTEGTATLHAKSEVGWNGAVVRLIDRIGTTRSTAVMLDSDIGLDLSWLSEGLYFVEITTTNGRRTILPVMRQ